MAQKETDKVSSTDKPNDSVEQQIADLQRRGRRMAKAYRRGGKSFIVRAFGPHVVSAGDEVRLASAVIKVDWKIAAKLEMVKAAEDIIRNSSLLGSLDLALPVILASVVEEKGLYEHSIGEFFQLYGQFEQKYGVFKTKETIEKMEALIQGDKKFLKPYKDHGKESLVPLPYAVRSILAHSKNSNTLDQEGKDIKNSIKLLRSWLR